MQSGSAAQALPVGLKELLNELEEYAPAVSLGGGDAGGVLLPAAAAESTAET